MSGTNGTARERTLVCLGCGKYYSVGMNIQCPDCGPKAFLRTRYPEGPLELQGPESQFESYRQWLPFEFKRELPELNIGCVRANELGAELGLDNLWLLISGYAPELGANLPTCTFKTLEGAGVLERVLSYSDKVLIISSAGNAGTASLEFATRWNVPAVVVVPASASDWMCTSTAPGATRPLLITLRGATYLDAIEMVGKMVERYGDRVVREGGAFNVARRDSMGVPVLRAAQAIGQIPDHYFQAVGSGTGAIAAHEAALRLSKSGTAGGPMRLHLIQNKPFTPMHDAWAAGKDHVDLMPRDEVLRRVSETYTHMLSNAKPPYSVIGGVRDSLRASDGRMYAVTNDEARAGHARVLERHGFSPLPEAGAAIAGLVQACKQGRIGRDDVTLVHLTGGGWKRSISELGRRPYPDHKCLDAKDLEGVASAVGDYLASLG